MLHWLKLLLVTLAILLPASLQGKTDFEARPALESHDFEVEDFHTYFVGESGVWVHNHGFSCDDAFSVWHDMTKDNLGNAAEAYLELTKVARAAKTSAMGRNRNLWAVIDELPKRIDELDPRVVALAREGNADEWKEAFAALLFERKTGKTFSREGNAQTNPFDFKDEAGNKYDMVGPTKFDMEDSGRIQTKIQQLRDQITGHFERAGEKGTPVLVLAGLADNQRGRLKKFVKQQAAIFGESFILIED